MFGLTKRGDRRASSRSLGVVGRSVPGGRTNSCAEFGERGDWKGSRRYNLELNCVGSCGRGDGLEALRRFANDSLVVLVVLLAGERGALSVDEVEVCSLRARIVSARVEFE